LHHGAADFSGVTTRLPNLKILIHHLGAMIPFRRPPDTGWATLGSRTSTRTTAAC
jgi:hypothetical protein